MQAEVYNHDHTVGKNVSAEAAAKRLEAVGEQVRVRAGWTPRIMSGGRGGGSRRGTFDGFISPGVGRVLKVSVGFRTSSENLKFEWS